ncbi:MAG: flavin reductase family protein [Alphaproteobacteria bacterium]|nr:flavin reductase family protein [Alphaproteobacteria bacterium]
MTGTSTITSAAFRYACGRFATGVTVVTAYDKTGQRWGLTVNSFASVSLDPPLVLFSIDLGTNSYAAITGADRFAINVLASDQQALSDRFSFVKDEDRFKDVPLLSGEADEPPMLAGCLCTIICDPENAVPGGDHTILIGRVRRIVMTEDKAAQPLLYYAGCYAGLMP